MQFILNGFKWFSSATDGDIALALARTDESQPDSSKGLSLFLIRMRDENTGKLNGIRIHRLKNKMGTRYLPTAELELDNCVGELVGQLNKGVSTISSVLNITRLYSACGALAGLGHGQQVATAFARTRHVSQSQLLSNLPLHTSTLLNVAVLYRALLQLFFHTTLLMGKVESGSATKEESMRSRFLTPALKAFSATRASEGYITLIESMGGQGYMEENGLAEALRDLTVERIWEGTPAIMSLDLLRVITQTQGAALSTFISVSIFKVQPKY
jgi:alkylation response protein AidB-like acyl-CoA dehydrogenase